MVVNCSQISIFARQKTTLLGAVRLQARCELLSNQYLCKIEDNSLADRYFFILVVNCSQISIFARQKTTKLGFSSVFISCELLSNQYLCKIEDNAAP